MNWNYSPNRPQPVGITRHLGMKVHTINYIITHMEEADAEGNEYRYKSVTLPLGVWNYDDIVSALINNEYPHDKMDAVVNNYLKDPDNEEFIAEMKQMQDWRDQAKAIALQALDYAENSQSV